MDSHKPHLRRYEPSGHEQLTAVDPSLAYWVGSSVLNRLPLYSRIRSYSYNDSPSSGEEDAHLGEKVGAPAGVRTPPPEYYDTGTLAEEADFERKRVVGLTSDYCSPSSASRIEMDETGSQGVVGDASESMNTGYFPDTGTKRFLKSFGSLLKTLGSEAPASDMISTWLPNTLGIALTESEEVVGGPMVVDHSHQASLNIASSTTTGHGGCNCFNCFQQRQMYLHWLEQSQIHGQAPQFHHHPQMQRHHSAPAPPPDTLSLCSSCQRPDLPPRPMKPLLHRFTAAVILQMFTIAFIVYPHVKAMLTTSYAWERRNHVFERMLVVTLVLSERMWMMFLWLSKLSGIDTASGSVQGWSEVDEQRVKKWLVRTSGEVLGGCMDGLQMGVGVWGAGVSGKGKGKATIVGV